MTSHPHISAVVPIYNEERNIPELHRRLDAALQQTGRSYEIVYIDDGSSDGGLAILLGLQRAQPTSVRVIELYRNYGQFNAITAGFERVRGEVIVTLDADLQNPPEEIPRLLARLAEGYDVVNGWRKNRHDSLFRRVASRAANTIAARTTGVPVKDYGCMLRAYRREVIDQVAACREHGSYVPTLANAFARRVTEIEVGHAVRGAGRSNYSLLKLINLQFDMLTSFSVLPLRMISLLGLVIACAGGGTAGLILLARALYGSPSPRGTPVLFALLFCTLGLLFIAIGMLGEYIGRIFDEVRMRPRYVVRRLHGDPERRAASGSQRDAADHGGDAGLYAIDSARPPRDLRQ